MTPIESSALLEKYGLDKSVKSLASYLQWPEPESMNNLPIGIKADIWGASFTLLCSLAEKGERMKATSKDRHKIAR